MKGSTQVTSVDAQGRNYIATVVRTLPSRLFWYKHIIRDLVTSGTSHLESHIPFKQLLTLLVDPNSS